MYWSNLCTIVYLIYVSVNHSDPSYPSNLDLQLILSNLSHLSDLAEKQQHPQMQHKHWYSKINHHLHKPSIAKNHLHLPTIATAAMENHKRKGTAWVRRPCQPCYKHQSRPPDTTPATGTALLPSTWKNWSMVGPQQPATVVWPAHAPTITNHGGNHGNILRVASGESN